MHGKGPPGACCGLVPLQVLFFDVITHLNVHLRHFCVGRLRLQVKIYAWYDNEWGYACCLADVARMVAGSLA